jgi:hypothetical protein
MKGLTESKIYLAHLGFFPQQNGFGYLAYALALLREDPMSLYCRNVNFIGAVADGCGVSPDCVRRCMCYSLNTAWTMPANAELRALFPGASGEFPPSLGEFIARAAIDIDLKHRPENMRLPGVRLIRQGFEASRAAVHSARSNRVGALSAVR